MPQGCGDYLVQSLRNNSDTKSIPVIVLTGHRDPELAGTMRRLGAQEFFTKPVPFPTLLEAMAKYIPLKKRAGEEIANP
jgi:FixJ family two-component response regulator